jgi:hypothetical protein
MITMKHNSPFLPLAVMALWPLLAPPSVRAQAATVKTYPDSDVPQAQVLSVHGPCEYSADGATFTVLKPRQIVTQGAVVRTGGEARADLFFRRIGTTVRLQPGTEVKFETMSRQVKDGKPTMQTLLDLRTGRIFTAVRSLVPGSTFEIKNAAGRSVVEGGGGNGRYIITADGTHVTEKNSAVGLKVIGETGVTVIAPGMKYSAKEGKLFAPTAPEAVDTLIAFDELDSLTEKLTVPDESPKAK